MPTIQIDNAVFTATILRSQQGDAMAQEALAKTFLILARNIVVGFQFMVDREEAIQNAVVSCLRYVNRFDPSRGAAFSLFTTISLNSIKQTYRAEQRERERKEIIRNRVKPDRRRITKEELRD